MRADASAGAAGAIRWPFRRVALNWPRRDRFDKRDVHYGMSDEEDHRLAASESLVIADCDDRLAELPPSLSVAARRLPEPEAPHRTRVA